MHRPAAQILLTRPRQGSVRFAHELRRVLPCDVSIHISPVMDIVPCDDAIDLGPVRGVILTSENAVPALIAKTDRRDLPVYTVGTRAADAARAAGFNARTAGEDADALVATLLQERPVPPLLHLRGAVARGNIAVRLSTHGLLTRDVVAYEQTACDLSADALALFRGAAPLVLPLFSPRSAALLSMAATGSAPRTVVALSWAVAAELPLGWAKTVVIAARPDGASMQEAITGLFDTEGFLETPATRG